MKTRIPILVVVGILTALHPINSAEAQHLQPTSLPSVQIDEISDARALPSVGDMPFGGQRYPSRANFLRPAAASVPPLPLSAGSFELRPSPPAQWAGGTRNRHAFLRPTLYVMGFQALGMGILLSMRTEVTGFDSANSGNLVRGFTTAPVWDKDGVLFNFVSHPIWGSESYLRARLARMSPMQSFLFSSASSVAWEYLFESWAEQPSVQDLLFTSTLGSLLGEVRFLVRRELQSHDGWWARALVVAIDPLNAILREVILLPNRIAMSLSMTAVTAPSPPAHEARSLAPFSRLTAGESMGFRVSVRF